jgi:hypothetical protein
MRYIRTFFAPLPFFSFSSFFSTTFSAAFSTATATFFFVPVAAAFVFATRPDAGARCLDVLAVPAFLLYDEDFLAVEVVVAEGVVVVESGRTRWCAVS